MKVYKRQLFLIVTILETFRWNNDPFIQVTLFLEVSYLKSMKENKWFSTFWQNFLFFDFNFFFSGMTSSDNEHAVYPWRGDHVDFAYILEFIGVKEADYLGRFSKWQTFYLRPSDFRLPYRNCWQFHLKTHKDYGYIWRKYAEKDKSASFRQRDQFIYLKDLTRFCQNVQHLFK